jgi:hypothetical protein
MTCDKKIDPVTLKAIVAEPDSRVWCLAITMGLSTSIERHVVLTLDAICYPR